MIKRPSQDPNERLGQVFAELERTVTGRTPEKPAQSQQELMDRLAKFAAARRLAWLRRQRVHTAIFEEVWLDDEIARLGVEPSENTQKERRERQQEIAAIAKPLRWSKERVDSFKKTVVDYRRSPTLENYLRVRRDFPEVEIQIGKFGGLDAVLTLEDDFRKQGIDPDLVAACLDSDEPSIDALCLRLIEKLVEREHISGDTPGHIEKRRAAISDTLVKYLIVIILESFDWNEVEVRIPASLVVLIRHQLTGTNPDLHASSLARGQKHQLAIAVAQMLKPGNKLTINKLASMAKIPRIRAARLLKDEDFKQWLELARGWVAEGLFRNTRE